MSNGKGGFIGQDGLNAPDPATGVSASGGDTQATVSFTAPSDVGGAAITGYSVQSNNGDGTFESSYDLNGASYDSVSFSVAGQDNIPTGLVFNNDGSKIYICGTQNESIYQYSVSTSYDISTASYDSVSFSVSGQESNLQGFIFSADGAKLFVVGAGSDTVYQYTLSTAFDLSTASYDSVSFSVAGQDTNPYDVIFNDDGTKMYIAGNGTDAVYQYSLSTGFDLSTASYNSVSFSVSGQDATPVGIRYNDNGTKLFMLGATNDSIYQYSLSTAFDLSTASYDSVSFSVASQSTAPQGVTLSADGTKMYVVDAIGDAVYQYSTGQLGYPTSSPVTVTGLTNGTSYTFNVWAINPFGWSSPSGASGGVTPFLPDSAFFGGGLAGYPTLLIETVKISTLGNTSNFGDLTQARYRLTGTSSATRGVFMGGTASGDVNTMDYITLSSLGDAVDFGDLTQSTATRAAVSNGVRGVRIGGGGFSSQTNVMDYITIASTGNATDFGDYRFVIARNAGNIMSNTRGISAGGRGSGVRRSQMEYITIASTGNGTFFGSLTAGNENPSGLSSSTRGVVFGGQTSSGGVNTIQYVTIATTGNAADFGDLVVVNEEMAGAANSTRGLMAGGSNGTTNVIQYITISTTGNASDFGDLNTGQYDNAGFSDCHGGLS